MQLVRRIRRRRGWAINIAPLIDVVFLLIIFSLTISQFTYIEAETLDLPRATEGDEAPPAEPRRLVINVRRDGTVAMWSRTWSLDDLARALADEAAKPGRGDLTVLLRGDRRAEWKHVARVMATCAARGIGRIRVAVLEPGAEGAD